MNTNIRHALLALAVLLSAAKPVLAQAYKYEPFPTLPTVAVHADLFASNLRDTCEALAKLPEALEPPPAQPAEGPRGRGAAAAAEEKSEDEPAALREAFKKNRAKIEAAAKTNVAQDAPGAEALKKVLADANKLPKPAPANAQQVIDFVPMLAETCVVLRSKAPVTLGKTDLEVLRTARDAPGILSLIQGWSGKAFGDMGFTEALAGTDGQGASFNVGIGASLGGLSDKLIRGMAEFLQKRAQAEALRYLREQLKKELCDKSDALVAASFSNTCAALDTLGDDMSLQALGSYLRAAAEQDLRKFPDLMLDHTQRTQPNELAPIAFTARLGVAYFTAVKGGRDPFEVLYSLGDLKSPKCANNLCSEVTLAIQWASSFAYALRQGGELWTNLFNTDLKEMDRSVVAVAVVLLAEKRFASLEGNAGFTFKSEGVNRFLITPLNVANDGIALAQLWSSLKERLSADLDEEARRAVMVDAMMQASERFTRLIETLDRARNGKQTSAITKGTEQARIFVGILAELAQRRYGLAVVSLLEDLNRLEITIGSTVSGKIAAGAKKYLPLLVEIASAESSNDVAAALDAYAAPLGSYELKYEKSMVAINGFVGGFAGWEKMKTERVHGTNVALGGWVPVGLHVSLPFKLFEGKFHVGPMFSLLDLGTVSTARVNEDPAKSKGDAAGQTATSSAAAQVGWKQVTAPGLYGVIGLLESPIVVGFGISYVPELREVALSDGSTDDASVFRYGGFLAIDVPIFPLN